MLTFSFELAHILANQEFDKTQQNSIGRRNIQLNDNFPAETYPALKFLLESFQSAILLSRVFRFSLCCDFQSRRRFSPESSRIPDDYQPLIDFAASRQQTRWFSTLWDKFLLSAQFSVSRLKPEGFLLRAPSTSDRSNWLPIILVQTRQKTPEITQELQFLCISQENSSLNSWL